MKEIYKRVGTALISMLSPFVILGGLTPTIPPLKKGNMAETVSVFKSKTPTYRAYTMAPESASKKTMGVQMISATQNKLTVTVEGDPEMYTSYVSIRIVGEEFNGALWLDLNEEESKTGTIDLVPGLYTVVAHFSKIDPDVILSAGPDVFVVAENVDMSSDQTITLDASTAKNRITAVSYIPGGEQPKLPTTHYIDGGSIEEEGNVNYLRICTDLVHKLTGSIYGSGVEGDFGVINDNDGSGFDLVKRSELWINDISSDLCVTQCRFGSSDDNGFYFSVMEPVWGVTDSVEGVYSKDFSDTYTTEYVPSIIGEESVKDGFEPIYTCGATQIFSNHSDSRFVNSSSSSKLWCAGLNQKDDPIKYGFQVWYSDYQETAYDEEDPTIEIGTMVYYTRTMPVRFNSDGTVSTYYTPLLGEYAETEVLDTKLVEAPAFSYNLNDCQIKLGDSQPSISFLSYLDYDWDTEDYRWFVTPAPCGRRGEFRAGDLVAMETWDTSETIDGEEHFTYNAVDQNQIVDGIQGVTTASFTCITDKTLYPPVLRQLQFRTPEGIVTDRFDSFSDVCLLFSAATYNQQFDPEMKWVWWYDVTSCDVKVSYSPCGENDWKEIDVSEDPEEYVAAFGHLYRASLANETSESSNGWFDLKIDLEAIDGTTSTQTISPAFKVADADSGVNSVVGPEEARIMINGNNAIAVNAGDAILDIFDLNGKLLMSGGNHVDFTGLPKGVYLVRMTAAGSEVTLKLAR